MEDPEKKIAAFIEANFSDDNLYDFCQWVDYFDHNNEYVARDWNDLFEGAEPDAVVRALFFGKGYRYGDLWMRFDAYGNAESTSRLMDWVSPVDVAEYLCMTFERTNHYPTPWKAFCTFCHEARCPIPEEEN